MIKINDENFKLIIIKLENIYKKLFSEKQIINIYVNNIEDNNDIKTHLIHIKKEHIPHLLGLQYWKKAFKRNNTMRDDQFLEYFFNILKNENNPKTKLEKILINNPSSIGENNRKKYSISSFFDFLIHRIIATRSFFDLIYTMSCEFAQFYFSFSTKSNSFYYAWQGKKIGIFELECISLNKNYTYETYILKSLKMMQKRNEKNYKMCNIRNISIK
ncbi:hypothetical protein NXS15_01090 [Mycoplasma sp. CSL7475-4]|uniref:hypothetical protein n=1 Tax=Mycoplasma sp. CSL7475-4 TaxID=2973942 RepID=UPI00216AC9FC|nr:hypothetical protein [Mycoplasma sp. CSL7475-4]MCS4536725.1 hypothetical protein [Mycoplasma sp. CSL7475-4]